MGTKLIAHTFTSAGKTHTIQLREQEVEWGLRILSNPEDVRQSFAMPKLIKRVLVELGESLSAAFDNIKL
jgi:hypothetical protein